MSCWVRSGRRFEKMKALVRTAAIMALTVPALAAAMLLSPTEIKATFGTGKPFTAASTSGTAVYSIVFKADGTATRTGMTSKAVTVGMWRVNDKGYCSKWGNGTESCYTVEQSGSIFMVRDSAGKSVSRWTVPA
jgi:hypothetical protein